MWVIVRNIKIAVLYFVEKSKDVTMRLLFLVMLFVAFSSQAEGKISFKNDREGKTSYSSISSKLIKKALKRVSSYQIQAAYNETLDGFNERNLCSFDLNKNFSDNLKAIDPKFDELEGAIYHLRELDEIDDVVVKILLKANETIRTNATYMAFSEDDLYKRDLPRNHEQVKKMLQIIGEFKSKYLSRSCFDEAYKMLIGDLNKALRFIKDSQLEGLYKLAYEKNFIDIEMYKLLEKARMNELDTFLIDLKSYHSKIKSLRIQYPLRDPSERSVFSTFKLDKNTSRRQRLLESYSDLQIILMGNVIKKLRERLEAIKVEILVYGNAGVIETIPLEPMERFRFAIRILRKEMAHLSLNTYFGGHSPSYIDLMSASYELGIIPSIELEEVSGLQEIWNPKKTFWDKANIWIKSFGTVATMLTPPPYGFIPALAIVAIEATVGKKNNKPDNMDLF